MKNPQQTTCLYWTTFINADLVAVAEYVLTVQLALGSAVNKGQMIWLSRGKIAVFFDLAHHSAHRALKEHRFFRELWLATALSGIKQPQRHPMWPGDDAWAKGADEWPDVTGAIIGNERTGELLSVLNFDPTQGVVID
jgi:hypothetical protein